MTRQVVLFTPGDSAKMVRKALNSDADMVILDIEDAVAPSEKDAACETIVSVLDEHADDEITVEIAVRINSLGTRGSTDLEKIRDAGPQISEIVLPKVKDSQTVDRLADLLNEHGISAGVGPIIEMPESIMNVADIASHPNVDVIEFGAEDYTTEVGGIQTDERTEIIYARQKIVAAANAAGIDAIDMAWPDFSDDQGLRRNTKDAVHFGYDGKSAIHPVQIPIIREIFTPTSDQVDWARAVVRAAEEAEKAGKVTFQLDGEMIDPPIIDRAKDLLERTNEQ